MQAPSERSFRTKTGRCVVHDDRLVLERSGARGALAATLFGNSLARVRAFYGLMVVIFLGVSASTWAAGQNSTAVLSAVVAVFLLRGILKSRGLSGTDVLVRAAITRVEAHAPVPPLTRGHFIVHFVENGQAVRRVVILPGTLEGGTAEYGRAVELLRGAGLRVE